MRVARDFSRLRRVHPLEFNSSIAGSFTEIRQLHNVCGFSIVDMSGGHLPSKVHNQQLSDFTLLLRVLLMGHLVMRNETFHRTSPRIAINQLRYLVTAAEYGSFRKAAEILNVKQSTLSRSVRLLEHETSVTIFNRSRKGITPSASGSKIIQLAQVVLEQIDALGSPSNSIAVERGKIVYRLLHVTVRR